jgi:hypothetical protein
MQVRPLAVRGGRLDVRPQTLTVGGSRLRYGDSEEREHLPQAGIGGQPLYE